MIGTVDFTGSAWSPTVPECAFGVQHKGGGAARRPYARTRMLDRIRLQDRYEIRLHGIAHRDEPQPLECPVRAKEIFDEAVGGAREQVVGGSILFEFSAAEDCDLVRHLHRFVEVVRDEDDGRPDLPLHLQEFLLDDLAVDGIDCPERLVHQHDRRIGRQRAQNADALLLAA